MGKYWHNYLKLTIAIWWFKQKRIVNERKVVKLKDHLTGIIQPCILKPMISLVSCVSKSACCMHMFMKCSYCCGKYMDSVSGSSQLDEWWLGGGWRAGDTSNEKINDDPFENANKRGAITISKWEQWGLLLVFIPQLAHLSLPPQYTHLHSNVHPCPEHKESLCEVFTYPRHPPPCSHLWRALSLSLQLMCSICWMMDWVGRGKSSHTFPVGMTGRPGGAGATSHVPPLLPLPTLCTTICPLI